MPPHKVLDEILRLDPQQDHQRIAYLITCYEFPFDTTRSLEFALFRTFAVPSVGALLDRTGEFGQRAQKRYDDTNLILSEICEYGYDSERGHAALKRMNHLHGRYEISNDDFLYVLSTFIYEQVRWNVRFGWRPMAAQEKLGLFYFWRAIGQHMNIKHIPPTYDEFERFNVEYERAHFHFAEPNRRVASATRDMFLSWFLPKPFRQIGAPAIYALLDKPLLDAFGFPSPTPAMRRLVAGSLKLRGRFITLLPERRRPKSRTQLRHRNYPHGYQIEKLGPPI
jgi:mpaB/rubber oxygenase-like protein